MQIQWPRESQSEWSLGEFTYPLPFCILHFSCVALFDRGHWVVNTVFAAVLFLPRVVTRNSLIYSFVYSPVLPALQPTPTWMTSANSCAAQATPVSLGPNDRRITQRAISRGFPSVPHLLVWSLGGCALMIYTTKWALTSPWTCCYSVDSLLCYAF